MTNFERYKTEILNYIENHGETPARVNGEFIACRKVKKCEDCEFHNTTGCEGNLIKWLYKGDDADCSPDASKPKTDLKGCSSCKYRDKTPDEDPCSECSRCYIDKFKPKPKKTRQSEFLKVYPNANVSGIQPCVIDKGNSGEYCSKHDWCSECADDYWSQEVE